MTLDDIQKEAEILRDEFLTLFGMVEEFGARFAEFRTHLVDVNHREEVLAIQEPEWPVGNLRKHGAGRAKVMEYLTLTEGGWCTSWGFLEWLGCGEDYKQVVTATWNREMHGLGDQVQEEYTTSPKGALGRKYRLKGEQVVG